MFRKLFTRTKPVPPAHQAALQRAQAAALRKSTEAAVAIWNDGRYAR